MGKIGVVVHTKAASAPRGEPTDNGVWFAADFAQWGPANEAVKVTSLDEFRATFGERVSYSSLFDSLELAFAEGLATAYVSREVGPVPVKATRTLNDRAGAPVPTLRIDALHHGDRGNRISVAVEDGTTANTFRLLVLFDGVEVERFDNMVMDPITSADYGPTRLTASAYVRGTDLGSATAPPNDNPAVLAASALAGGTDDRASATSTEQTAALNAFTKDLGPGQVSLPGRSTQAAHEALIDHAKANNRTAYLDASDQASRTTLIAARDLVKARAGAEYAGLFGSWYDAPPLAGSSALRAVPGSAFAAGVSARTDALEGTSGAAPAGEVSTAQHAVAVRVPAGGFSEADFEALNDAGVNMSRNFRNRGVQLYGFRSITTDPDWLLLTANRLRVSLAARCEAIGARFVFAYPNTKTFSDLNGALSGECLSDFNAGALYGESPEEAFRVDTGDTVNTPQTIADRKILAKVYGRFTPFAELVELFIVKVPVTSSV